MKHILEKYHARIAEYENQPVFTQHQLQERDMMISHYRNFIADIETLLNSIEEMWIPVTDRMPEDDTVVLGSNGNWVQQLDYNSERYRQKGFWFNENDAEYTTDYTDKITHWQYLPTPPKG